MSHSEHRKQHHPLTGSHVPEGYGMPSAIKRDVLREPVPMPTPPNHLIHGPLHRALGLDSRAAPIPKKKSESHPAPHPEPTPGPARRIANPDAPPTPSPQPPLRISPRIIPTPHPPREPLVPDPAREESRARVPIADHLSRMNTGTIMGFRPTPQGHTRFMAPSARENPTVKAVRELLSRGVSEDRIGEYLGSARSANHALRHIRAADNRKKWNGQRTSAFSHAPRRDAWTKPALNGFGKPRPRRPHF